MVTAESFCINYDVERAILPISRDAMEEQLKCILILIAGINYNNQIIAKRN